jgi:hypothetical protein
MAMRTDGVERGAILSSLRFLVTKRNSPRRTRNGVSRCWHGAVWVRGLTGKNYAPSGCELVAEICKEDRQERWNAAIKAGQTLAQEFLIYTPNIYPKLSYPKVCMALNNGLVYEASPGKLDAFGNEFKFYVSVNVEPNQDSHETKDPRPSKDPRVMYDVFLVPADQ